MGAEERSKFPPSVIRLLPIVTITINHPILLCYILSSNNNNKIYQLDLDLPNQNPSSSTSPPTFKSTKQRSSSFRFSTMSRTTAREMKSNNTNNNNTNNNNNDHPIQGINNDSSSSSSSITKRNKVRRSSTSILGKLTLKKGEEQRVQKPD